MSKVVSEMLTLGGWLGMDWNGGPRLEYKMIVGQE